MCILADGDITRSLEARELAIRPYVEKHLTPNGYDLTVAEVLVPPQAKVVAGKATIPPKSWFAVSTAERVELGPGLAGQLWIRSSYARRGVLAAFGKVEAGFHGTLTVGAFHAGSEPLELPIGERFCQIVFERMASAPRKLYAERSGTYQNQSGLTLAKDKP